MLSDMRSSGSHLAVVSEADGTVLGVLFLEDIVEELIGEVRDLAGRRATEAGARTEQAPAARDQ